MSQNPGTRVPASSPPSADRWADEPASRLLEHISSALRSEPRYEIPLESLTPAGVLLPLVQTPGGLKVLFTVRSTDVEHHKGEISFPGGRVDPRDKDTLATALREAEEEVGVRPADVRVLGVLDDAVSISGYRITPHVAYLPDPAYPFRPAPREVAEILLVPLSHLLDPRHRGMVRREGDGALVPCFHWGNHVVWGLTAAILKRFLDLTCGPRLTE